MKTAVIEKAVIEKDVLDDSQHLKALWNARLMTKKARRKIMLFDLAVGGHHGGYIRYFVNVFLQNLQQDTSQQNTVDYTIEIVVLPAFMSAHAEVVQQLSEWSQVQFLPLSHGQQQMLLADSSRWGRLRRYFVEWRLLGEIATQQQADHCLVMYLDTYRLPLALGKALPCPISGIYFRPDFHYSALANTSPSWRDRIKQTQAKWVLGKMLKHPQFRTLFCLDPFAVPYIAKTVAKTTANVVHLPDPVEVIPGSKAHVTSLRSTLGIDPSRQVYLLFGALDSRKGIYQTLAAIESLSPEVCQKICLLLVGATHPAEQARIHSLIEQLRQKRPVQVIERYEFVSEHAVPAYFQLADRILSLYQNHVGMSGILLQAAAAQKPVLSSNYGLMGALVKRYRLGLAVAAENPEVIAAGFRQMLAQPNHQLCDLVMMAELVEKNSVQHFATTLSKHLV